MPKVALVKCKSYDYGSVKEAVKKGINLIGGAKKFVKKGEKILLKPNIIGAFSPEKAVTTHPAVFQAAAEMLKNAGAEISYGDSPSMGSSEEAARESGIMKVGEELGLTFADFETGEEIYYEEGKQNKKFVIARGVLDADGCVSVSKLKSHTFMRMTGAIKNQFGCIPGSLKFEFHIKLHDAHDFGKMLVDLNMFVSPRLFIMDGIQAMEGRGPRKGTLLNMNLLLFSEDPVALDATVCRLIDVDPATVPTIKSGKDFGLGTYLQEEIEIVGDKLEEFKVENFDVNREPLTLPLPKKIAHGLANQALLKPIVVKDKCTTCGKCVEICPTNPKAINRAAGEESGLPEFDYRNCLRCYSCREVCPEGAIELKKPFLRKPLMAFTYKVIMAVSD
ncbi:MAG: DUF362 domain-containing protein [bacterium]|nr:DUF362 domain-containing protein [bacterium]